MIFDQPENKLSVSESNLHLDLSYAYVMFGKLEITAQNDFEQNAPGP